jgi:DNA-binding response OmpR family regulator
MHVLLVDDDVPLRQVLARFLHGAGVDTISEADDGEAALAALERIRPDLVLTDCEMPRLDGISLVHRLRARGNAVPVIMLSAQGDPHVIVTAIKAGVNNYLHKPFHPDLLLEKIRQTMGIDALAATA